MSKLQKTLLCNPTAVSEVPEILEPGIAAGNCWEDHLTSELMGK